MEITSAQIKELRDKTGISVMQCKKALEEAGGDMEKALVILLKSSKTAALKKQERELKAGTVRSYIHSTGTVGAMVLLSCETDFVARNEEFKQLAYDIAMHIAAADPAYLTMEEIPANEREKATEVFEKEVEGKPEAMKAQILEGKLNSYFKERVLMEQSFIKNPELTIRNLVEAATQKFGERTEVSKYVRFNV